MVPRLSLTKAYRVVSSGQVFGGPCGPECPRGWGTRLATIKTKQEYDWIVENVNQDVYIGLSGSTCADSSACDEMLDWSDGSKFDKDYVEDLSVESDDDYYLMWDSDDEEVVPNDEPPKVLCEFVCPSEPEPEPEC